MRVSISWLRELVNLKVSLEEVIRLLPSRTIGTKEVTEDFIELDMKGYNRADLLSMRGVAFEVAAITNSEVTFTEPLEENFIWNQQKLPNVSCEIVDKKLCEIQGVAKIEGLKIAPSKEEWVKKLTDSGMRSVNNVVDITNLVMLEYGQPLHSFNATTIKNGTIIVRAAKAGEEITTLDGKLRKLDPSDIVLADTQGVIDVAGVMGGKDTETSGGTNAILLTASLFNAQMIMRTANKLGLHSEASKRFQHGLTKKGLLQAFDAAIKMYAGLGGKLTAISLIGNFEDKPKTVKLTQEKINSLIGVNIAPQQVEGSLKKLGFALASQGVPLCAWEVTVPYWRLDIGIEEDLIEEVARMYGYENIPAKPLEGKIPEKIDQGVFDLIYQLKTTLVSLGLTEIQTYSFYSTAILENLDLDEDKLIKIANPMSAETEYMRDMLWPNLLETVIKNFKQQYQDIAIFEIGRIYYIKDDQPEEKYILSLALSNGTDNPTQELYSLIQALSKQVNLGLSESPIKHAPLQPFFHPNRSIYLSGKGKSLGFIAEVHPRIINKFGVEKRVAVAELVLS